MFGQFTRFGRNPESNVIELGKPLVEPVAVSRAEAAADAELIARLDLKSRLHDALLDRLNLSAIERSTARIFGAK